jgi:hypothetical protein
MLVCRDDSDLVGRTCLVGGGVTSSAKKVQGFDLHG